MAFAFGHLIGGWVFGKLLEISKKLSKVEWVVLLFGAILPDIDFLVEWTTNIEVHRLFTHSITFAIIATIVVFVIASLLKNKNFNPKSCAALIFAGICVQLLLDMPYSTGVQLFWPYELWFSYFGIVSNYNPLPKTLESYKFLYKGAVLDMGLGVLWLGWLTFRKRINY